jgi:hypothetical protein
VRLVQWAFDERELSSESGSGTTGNYPASSSPHPRPGTSNAALKDPARLIFDYLLPGVVMASLPLPLALPLYYLCELSEEPGLLGVLDAPVQLLLEWGYRPVSSRATPAPTRAALHQRESRTHLPQPVTTAVLRTPEQD